MIHHPELLDKLSEFRETQFADYVYRCTGLTTDPMAFSYSGGRWSPVETSDGGFPVLYTSLDRQGALAEVASYLLELSPVPKMPLKVTKLSITAEKVLRLAEADLRRLDVNTSEYTHRNYSRTQKIGAAINFLGFDGFLVPSARWPAENLIICGDGRNLERIEESGSEQVDWPEWHSLFEPPPS